MSYRAVVSPRWCILLLALGGGAFTARPADASDGALPRTPVVHIGTECLVVVDRSSNPSVHLDYTVPFADTCVTSDEAPQSRTHQFLATCRGTEPGELLPAWVSQADVAAANEAGAIPDDLAPTEGDILESSPTWKDCWTRIVPDAERRAITCEAALPGIDWDTTGLPAGAWTVWGYTYQPPINQWTRRTGVVKIADDQHDPPAVALEPHAPSMGVEGHLSLEACWSAPDGSQLTLSWFDGTSWHPLETEPLFAHDGVTSLEVPAPLEVGETFWLAVEVATPDGHVARYVSTQDVYIRPGPSTEWEPPVPYDYCRENPNANEPQRCPGTDQDPQEDATGGEGEDGGEAGCDCGVGRSNPTGIPSLIAGLGLLALTGRGRRHHASGHRRAGVLERRQVSPPDSGTLWVE